MLQWPDGNNLVANSKVAAGSTIGILLGNLQLFKVEIAIVSNRECHCLKQTMSLSKIENAIV